MRRTSAVLFGTLALSVLGSTAYAGSLTLETTAAALGTNDTVTWGQLGSDGTPIANTFAATSAGSLSVGGAFSASTGQVVDAGTSWTPVTGAFANGDALIWANDNVNGTGPITFTFPAAFGVGAAIQSDAAGQFTAQIALFDGATLLGTESEISDRAGDAIFLGALDTADEVTSAVFSLTAVTPGDSFGNAQGDFAVDTLNLVEPVVTATPEPGSIFLLTGGLAGICLLRRRLARA